MFLVLREALIFAECGRVCRTETGSGVPNFSSCLQLISYYSTGFTCSCQSHAIFGFDFRIPRTPLITFTPANWCVDDSIGLDCRFENGQGKLNHVELHRLVTRNSEWITKREIGEQESRHCTVSDDVEGRANDHGRDAILFQNSRRQTHGLMTDGSERNEEGKVRTVLLAPP